MIQHLHPNAAATEDQHFLYSPIVSLRHQGGHWTFDVDWGSSFQYVYDDSTGDTTQEMSDELSAELDAALSRAFRAGLLTGPRDVIKISNRSTE